MTIQTFEDVVAWQKSKQLYTLLYRDFANSRDYAYKDQLLRAALSISNNIAEGFDRGSSRELRQFLIISRGSAAEVRSMLYIVLELEIIPAEKAKQYLVRVKEISRLLTGFIKSIPDRKLITENR